MWYNTSNYMDNKIVKNENCLQNQIIDLGISKENSEKIITLFKDFLFNKFLNDPQYEGGLTYCKNCGLCLDDIK